ncbi:MAG: hypothetical protein K0S51_1828 [Bacillales bacterium]|jgi:uncharacterized protein (DUF1697 family)|nr:hypothetical protein [Bacillales bacterium]
MKTYIALLRGINVGGKNKIKMEDLKEMLESIGPRKVQTYIQSGNVLFESDEAEDIIRQTIEKEIEKKFGFFINVVLRSSVEIKETIHNCPFSDEEIRNAESTNTEGESRYVAFLDRTPDDFEILLKYKQENEDYKVVGRDIYFLFNNSIRNSKLINNLHRLGVQATVRNWKTVNKIYELLKNYI